MKAIRIKQYGGPDVLTYEDAPVPSCREDDVLVRVVGASVNPVDWKIREGRLASALKHTLPLIPGWDVSGVVAAVGSRATRFKVGDAVFARPDITRDGTFAEFVAVRETEAAPKPATLSHIEAATLPLAGLTAWESLIVTADLRAGQRVLVHAAAGGVGTLAVQLAKWRGAHVVATASARNHDLVRALGADEVIDYRSTPFWEATRDLDVVFDTVGGDTQIRSWPLLKRGGILVSITTRPSEVRALSLGVRAAYVFVQPSAEKLAGLAQLVDGGRLRPVVGAEVTLKDTRRAHEISQSGHTYGKIAVYVGQP